MAWRWSVCGTAEVVWKTRFLWQWPSAHLHCWVWCLSSSSWQWQWQCWVQVRRVCWPIKHSNTMVIEPAFGTFGSVGRCQVLLENEISISIKLVSRRKHGSALKFPGRWLRWLWTSENTVDQHQQMTWQPKSSLTVEASHWTSSNMDSVPLHSSSRLWDLDFQMKCKIYFHLKRGLWTTELFFSTAQVRCFWCCLWFRSGLVALFCLSVVTLDALTPASVHSLWSSHKCLNQLCLTVFSSFQSSLLLVHLFLPNSSFQSTLHLICFDTALCKQPPLSVMTLCDLHSLWRVSMFVFWTIANSAVFSIIVVSKNKRYPEFIL